VVTPTADLKVLNKILHVQVTPNDEIRSIVVNGANALPTAVVEDTFKVCIWPGKRNLHITKLFHSRLLEGSP